MQRLGPVLGSFGADPGDVRRTFIDRTMVNVGGTPASICVAFESDLHHARLPRSSRGNPSTPIPSSADPCIYGRVPIYTDGAVWYFNACRWAGMKRVVYGRPLRDLMERMVQYVKDGTKAFDDPFRAGWRRPKSGRAFEHVLNWLSAFTFVQDFMFDDRDPKRPPLVRREEEMPPWLNEMRRMLRL